MPALPHHLHQLRPEELPVSFLSLFPSHLHHHCLSSARVSQRHVDVSLETSACWSQATVTALGSSLAISVLVIILLAAGMWFLYRRYQVQHHLSRLSLSHNFICD